MKKNPNPRVLSRTYLKERRVREIGDAQDEGVAGLAAPISPPPKHPSRKNQKSPTPRIIPPPLPPQVKRTGLDDGAVVETALSWAKKRKRGRINRRQKLNSNDVPLLRERNLTGAVEARGMNLAPMATPGSLTSRNPTAS